MTPSPTERPIRAAVVGAGPAGFYTAAALIDRLGERVSIDLIERLPAPYGLVRYGVAPDHPKLKSVTRLYERIALSDAVRFIGNVTVGRDVAVEELGRLYDLVVYAVGAQTDRLLGVPGEELANCISSTVFVAWYNAHPDFAQLALSLDHERVAVVGIGNVAIDVARILAKPAEELGLTDIADPALESMRRSRVREIHVLARRGPAQARCTPTELRELAGLEDVSVHVSPADLAADPGAAPGVPTDRRVSKNLEIFRDFAAAREPGARRIHFHFFTSPVEILGEKGRVTGLRLQRNELRLSDDGASTIIPSDERETLDVSLVIRAIGYRSTPIEGLPFDTSRGLVPNDRGRVLDPGSGRPVPGAYVAGWVKRGPRGLIGANKQDAAETVGEIAADLPGLPLAPDPAEPDALLELLAARGVRATGFDHWQLLDRLEIARGKSSGRPRVKFGSTREMLEKLDEHDPDDA